MGAAILGPKYGSILGTVWGALCLVKAYMEPIAANVPFQNPMVSLVPRIIVGLVVGLIVYSLTKTKLPKVISVSIATIVGTLTNTALVLTALKIFGGFELLFGDSAKLLTTIFSSIVAVNGVLELVAALILVPSIYMATHKIIKNKI
jgi:uncharacterized membrane protein